MVNVEVGMFSVPCWFGNVKGNFCWFFSGVYGPTQRVEREGLWEELGALRGLWDEPWCVAGDFNTTRFPVEHSGGGRLNAGMRRFSEVIEELDLRDLPL